MYLPRLQDIAYGKRTAAITLRAVQTLNQKRFAVVTLRHSGKAQSYQAENGRKIAGLLLSDSYVHGSK
jgi:hypothetical protein